MRNAQLAATLSNLELLLKRAAQRNKDSEEDARLESKLCAEIARIIKTRKDSMPKLDFAIRAELDSAYPPAIQGILDEWMDVLEFCETAAVFHSKTYGKGNETFLELSERARTMRECVVRLSQALLNNE